MSTVDMHIDAFHALAIDIASQVGALVYHQTTLAGLPGTIGESGSEKARTYYQIVVFFHISVCWEGNMPMRKNPLPCHSHPFSIPPIFITSFAKIAF